jgi:hypothetical protein
MAWYCRNCGKLGAISGDRPKMWCMKCHADEWRYEPIPPGRVTRYPGGLEGLRDLPGQPPLGGRSLPGGLEGLRDLPGWKD